MAEGMGTDSILGETAGLKARKIHLELMSGNRILELCHNISEVLFVLRFPGSFPFYGSEF